MTVGGKDERRWNAGVLLRSLRDAALNVVYPPRCPSCRKPDASESSDPARLCKGCADELNPVLPPFCERCGETFSGNTGPQPFSCGNCAGREYAFDFAIASYEAVGLARDLVHRFKYQREYHLRLALAGLLEPVLNDSRIAAEDDWVMIPVPLHSRRRREREFNQAAEISRIASRRFGMEHRELLRRTRYTTQQAHLDRRDRLLNLRGAFDTRKPAAVAELEGRNLMLVDDVFTTGATLHECAVILRKHVSPAKLVAVTVARG